MKRNTPPVVLTIAGSDCSGGAGIQADIKTISALGGYAASVITALTAQNTQGVALIEPVSQAMLDRQIEMIANDLEVAAIKIGMVHHAASAQTIADRLRQYPSTPIVCDPVMISTSGSKLMQDDTIRVMEESIFPLSTLITPNLHEASMLAQSKIEKIKDMYRVTQALFNQYGCAVLVKGGHLEGDKICDILYDGQTHHEFHGKKVTSKNLHGTGCTLSSAIATHLAQGYPLHTAIKKAKAYITDAITAAAPLSIGKGNGPLWHFFALPPLP